MRMRFSLFLTLAVVGVMLFALMQPSLALADEATPPPETQEVEPTPPPETVTETEEAPEGTVQGDATEQTPEQPAQEAEEQPAPVEATEPEELDLSKILEQAPEGTEVVVLDENGEPLAMATQEAADSILVGDPMWCPVGDVTVTANCVNNATVAGLLPLLVSKNEPGTIYFMSTYASNDALFDGTNSNLSLLMDDNLTIQGGWNGVTTLAAPINYSGDSTFSVPLKVVNWGANVTLNDIVLTGANDSFASLQIETTGTIDVNDVDVTGNTTGSGADLDTCMYDSGTGLCTGTGSITVDDSTFNSNAFKGLVTDSASDTDLTNVAADTNGLAGAEITGYDDDGTGDVTVTNSHFSGSIGGYGLDVLSDGIITLSNVVADSNFTGGILLDATGGTGTISVVAASHASSNTGTGLDARSNGDITLTGFTADTNGANGAYLIAYGTGNIDVNGTSGFSGNANYGLFAKSAAGDIDLSLVTANTNSAHGAFLKTYSGGNVTVANSTFNTNTLSGLVVVSSGQVDLNNVTADGNGEHGTEVYSVFTYACRGANNITVNVDAGTFTNNMFYGLYVVPGASGSLVLSTAPAPTFTPANGDGDYLLVLEDPVCPKDVKPVSKPLKIVDVPFKAGPSVEQECDLFSGSMLVLPNGSSIKIACPYTGETQLEGLSETELPGPLGAGGTFQQGLVVKFNSAGQPVLVLTEGGLLTLSFELPEDDRGRRHSILFWDPTANNGLGAWIQLPPFEFGTSFRLYPDDPEDERMVFSGIRQQGNSVNAMVNFPGIFILVSE
jgi:hypothetical protein